MTIWKEIEGTPDLAQMLGESEFVWLFGHEMINLESGEIVGEPVLCGELDLTGGNVLGFGVDGQEYLFATHYLTVFAPEVEHDLKGGM